MSSLATQIRISEQGLRKLLLQFQAHDFRPENFGLKFDGGKIKFNAGWRIGNWPCSLKPKLYGTSMIELEIRVIGLRWDKVIGWIDSRIKNLPLVEKVDGKLVIDVSPLKILRIECDKGWLILDVWGNQHAVDN